MKTALFAAAMLALSTLSASALELRAPAAAADLYTCAGRNLSRVALQAQAAPQPAPCCAGLMGCPQLLANTGLIRPKRDNHT